LEHNADRINAVKETLELINQMQADGVICHYAIGGALAAVCYSEPADREKAIAAAGLRQKPKESSVASSKHSKRSD
jgi:hypothetical protein